MASYLDKFKVKVGIDTNTKQDMDCQHITTADFMQLNPVYVKEMVPGERLVVTQETFTRLAPMPVPTFGRANVHNRGFFVPYRTIFKGWNDFITDTKHVGADGTNGFLSSVPYMTLGDLVTAFLWKSDNSHFDFLDKAVALEDGDETVTTEGYWVDPVSGSIFDLVLDTDLNNTVAAAYGILDPGLSTPGHVAVLLNAKGRQMKKVLESLGYKFNGSVDYANEVVSALPLLAFLKVYMDWYYPAQYYDDVTSVVLRGILDMDTAGSVPNLGISNIATIMMLVTYVNYDSKYVGQCLLQ